jgi:hypothetical protein
MRETGATPDRHAARSRGHPGIFAPSCMTKRLDAARPDATDGRRARGAGARYVETLSPQEPPPRGRFFGADVAYLSLDQSHQLFKSRQAIVEDHFALTVDGHETH